MTESNKQEDPAVTRFRQYLRIKSVHPTPDYGMFIIFILRMYNQIIVQYFKVIFGQPLASNWFKFHSDLSKFPYLHHDLSDEGGKELFSFNVFGLFVSHVFVF